jgi:TolB-like protein
MPPSLPIRFGAFELDFDTGEIRKHGRKLKLAPQPFQALALLARSSGQLVTRETIRAQLWGSNTFVDFEHGLNFCIRQIRSALGESAKRPRFIETLPRRGYRFVLSPATRDNRRGTRARGATTRDSSSAPPLTNERHTTSVVVLEFENLNRDDGSDWLATAIAETLATDLSRLRSVRVASGDRTRAMMRQLDGVSTLESRPSYLELGRHMGADWVVTGSYQQAGGRLRITPQLLNVGSGEILAVGKTDGTWDEIFELQDRVASRLIEALKLTNDAEAIERITAPETRLLEAYEQYSRGRRGLYQMGKGTLEEARQHFESALALDPDYAMAHSGIGSTHAIRLIHKTNPEDLRLARAHLERARELDPELAEPYPWLCYLYIRDGRLPEALQVGQRAVHLLPDLVHAQYFLGIAYFASCESMPVSYQSAVNHLCEAARIDPSWQPTWYNLAAISLLNGNYPSAEDCAQRLLRLSSHESGPLRFIGAEIVLGAVELRRGNFAGAVRWFAESLTTHGRSAHVYRDLICAFSACRLGDSHLRHGSADLALTHYRRGWQYVQEAPTMLAQERAGTRALAGMAAAYGAKGELERARELLSQALQWLPNARLPERVAPEAWLTELLYAIAVAHVRTGQTTEALDMLEQVVGTGWRDANWLEQDPEMRPLLHQPQFIGCVEQVRRARAVEVVIPAAEMR